MNILKKKKASIFLTTLILTLTLFCGIKVKAGWNDYNGGFGSTTAGDGTCPEHYKAFCHFHISLHNSVKLTLIYYDSETDTRKRLGYAYATNNYSELVGKLGFKRTDKLITNSNVSYSKKLENWLLSKEGQKAVLNKMGLKESQLNKPSCLVDVSKQKGKRGNCYKKSGYRIIIEPLLSWYYDSKVVFLTVKELAGEGRNGLSNSANWLYAVRHSYETKYFRQGYLNYMYTEYDDIDVLYKNPNSYNTTSQVKNDLQTIASPKIGIGYNIIDISNWAKPHCSAFLKPEHYEAQASGRLPANASTGSGPTIEVNGKKIKVNCCKEVEKVLTNPNASDNSALIEEYKKEYEEYAKGLGLKTNIGISGLYKAWLAAHPECMQDKSIETPPNLACDGDNVSRFGDEASSDDMLASVGGERGQSNQNISESKFLKKQINQYCKILCNEKIELTFPIQYQQHVNKGSLIVWPTQEKAAISNQYPLTAKGNANCILYVDNQKLIADYSYPCKDSSGNETVCRNYQAIRNIRNQCEKTTNNINKSKETLAAFYDLKGTFRVTHTDEEYGNRNDIVLDRYDDGHNKYKVTGFPVSASSNTSPFTIEQKVKYKIPDKIYRYIITKKDGTVKSSDTLNSAIGKDYIDLKYGNLPVSYEAKGNYDLFIKYLKIGGFKGSEKVKQEKIYNCTYYVPDDTKTDGCKCTSGEFMGKDLTQAMAGGEDGNLYTCEEAKEKFCSAPDGGGGDDDDDDDKKYCPKTSEYEGKDYYGGGYQNMQILTDKCEASKTCTALTCNLFVCPPNTPAAGRPLNVIIAQYLANHPNTTLNAALIDYLISCSCNDEDNIIYRVIDLKTPFPGKTGEGRKAGFNWDDETLIKEKITKNRNVSDDAIYTESKIMYHFKLDVNTLRAIRNYNKSNSYSDYTLTCKKEGKQNCISTFVHNPTYGIQSDGTCFNSISFETCRN